MSISQLDPSLLSSQPLNQSPGTPNLADLSLGSEFSGISMGRTRSEADPNRANEKPKRSGRTKAQMAAYRADLERSKKLTAVEKITEGAKRGRENGPTPGHLFGHKYPGVATLATQLTVWLKMAENRTNHQDFNHPEPRRYPPAWNQDGVNGGPSSMSLLVNWLVNNGNFNRWLSCGLNGPLQEERLALCSEVEQILRAHGIMTRPPRY
ncbi:hypothetical protein PtA15_8A221 [Puccinia triticina]|uniref:Uncharacterized protein n=1 Tax=Puccinia triticina TaxID=208348 RepID=A0ABY7CTL5_9BASI|nr:uncharacterized protein PtA15_8A221 [Puccinia triticina]WAQ87317.1 hypothetical protein PtA15_8A221 [Puccinia triticina]